MKLNKYIALILFILSTYIAAYIGGLFTASSVHSWYDSLLRPSWGPPKWIFGPVWFTLYTMMGISVWLVFIKNNNKTQIYYFYFQLLLNTLWSYFFFYLQNPFYGFLEIVALWFSIIAMITSFYKTSKISSYLLLPYLFWVSFAAILNWAIWKMN